MSRRLLVWIGLAAAAVIAAVTIVVAVRGAKRANPTGVEKPTYTLPGRTEEATQAGRLLPRGLDLKGPRIVQNDAEGRPIWSAKSDGEFSLDEAAGKIIGKDVFWQLTRNNEIVKVQAGRMEIDWESGQVAFGKGVSVMAPGDRRFEVGRARYEVTTGKLICNGGVKWQSKRFAAGAEVLVVDVPHKKIRLRGDVRFAMK